MCVRGVLGAQGRPVLSVHRTHAHAHAHVHVHAHAHAHCCALKVHACLGCEGRRIACSVGCASCVARDTQPSIYRATDGPLYLSSYRSTYLSIQLQIDLSIYLSSYRSTYLSIQLQIDLSIYRATDRPICYLTAW